MHTLSQCSNLDKSEYKLKYFSIGVKMQVFFAEFCGRWGCTWQEAILTLFFMHLELAIFLIVLLIIFIISLLFLPIILIQDIKDNQKTDSDKIARRIAFAIKGVQVLSKLRRKNLTHINAIENNEPEMSQKESKLLNKIITLRFANKLKN